MKKYWFLVLSIVFLAAGCAQNATTTSNSQQNSQTGQVQTTPTPTPTPSATSVPSVTPTPTPTPTNAETGAMPGMTYKITKSQCTQGNTYTTISLSADGSYVATATSNQCEIGKVEFLAGNSRVVYFAIMPSGMGGYITYQVWPNLYELNLETKKVTKIFSDSETTIEITSDLKTAYYAAGTKLKAVTLADRMVKSYSLPPVLEGGQRQTGNIKLSPDGTKVAIVFSYGPDALFSEIYTINLSTGKSELYKRILEQHVQIDEWINNSEIRWSYINT